LPQEFKDIIQPLGLEPAHPDAKGCDLVKLEHGFDIKGFRGQGRNGSLLRFIGSEVL
jgi:hypothetical protein